MIEEREDVIAGAARALAAVPATQLTPEQQAARSRGLDEYRKAQELDADRAEAHLNLGALHAELGEPEEAEREYHLALKLSPRFPPAYVNLGDLYRQLGRDEESVRTLETGLQCAPHSADLHYSFGLALARVNRTAEATEHLARAAELSPGRERYAYVYGVALNSFGQSEAALQVLKSAHQRHSGSRDILMALATICRDRGERAEAIAYARKLADLDPRDPAGRELVAELEGAGR